MSIDHFGPEAQARIAEAVRRAETLSRGEIVPVVVGKSDAYGEVAWRGGFLLGAAATAVALLLPGRVGVAELPVLQVAAGLVGAWLSRWDPVERLLAGRRAMEEAVRARALAAFEEHDLARTADGTGVLLFASLFERRAVVLGDHGIDAKMADGEWDKVVAALVGGMRDGNPADGFEAAIALCGARLAQHFPRGGDPRPPENELGDAIRVERE